MYMGPELCYLPGPSADYKGKGAYFTYSSVIFIPVDIIQKSRRNIKKSRDK